MPRIYDNIDLYLENGLKDILEVATHADFCVGYFNLRGWSFLAPLINSLKGKDFVNQEGNTENRVCRLLVGMQKMPIEYIKELYSRMPPAEMDREQALKLKRKVAEQFREQLTIGKQSNEEEENLRNLLEQLKAGKLVVKLYLKKQLHAKLYLGYREDKVNPIMGFVGSSNLTFSGLYHQCELNLDVVDEDAGKKLSNWFQERWDEKWCFDITAELIQILEESWIVSHTPYQIYLKVLYHLSQEARSGISEFKIPKEFKEKLLKFQEEAVQRAAKMLNLRGGVLIGDVVGLGKTITAAAIAKIFEENHKLLIICPANLTEMWEEYNYKYDLGAKIISLSKVTSLLPDLRPYNLVIIDESHNLRNPESKRYKAIKNYFPDVRHLKVILLSATPFNKSNLDLSAQLKLFIPSDKDLGIAPEKYIEAIGGRPEFNAKHEGLITSIAAFEKSDKADDWRDLMSLYMVRRTRSYIKKYFALTDQNTGRKYLLFPNGVQQVIPDRKALKVEYPLHDGDQYAKFYSEEVVEIINNLDLPRYGLGLDDYAALFPSPIPTKKELEIKANLGKAGKRLKGFARTNLFKRLESSGHAFILSLKRHIMRNYLFIYAIDNNLELPIGQQDMGILDGMLDDDDFNLNADTKETETWMEDYNTAAQKYYQDLVRHHAKKYDWIGSHLFNANLRKCLEKDAKCLLDILGRVKVWNPEEDKQLLALQKLLSQTHPNEKVLVFTQFADTAHYLHSELKKANISHLEVVTGQTDHPSNFAKRFSPISNEAKIPEENQIRVLIATDVLSEGQNLQDSHIILNYDLPWAIIRIIQRAGRVDRIGQKAHEILCYSFLPEDGIDKIINLRTRLKGRLEESDEIIGSPDEIFFPDQQVKATLDSLYANDSKLLDNDEGPVDLATEANGIWQEELKKNPEIASKIPTMPAVVYSARQNTNNKPATDGVVMYAQITTENDVLTWLDNDGQVLTTSQSEILKSIACGPNEPTLQRAENHHELVDVGMAHIIKTQQTTGGQLGRSTGIRYRIYHLLKEYNEKLGRKREDTFAFAETNLSNAIQQVYDFPLQDYAKERLASLLKTGSPAADVARAVTSMYEDGKLCIVTDDRQAPEPQIICSLGMITR